MPQIPTLENRVSPQAAPDTRRRPLDQSGMEQFGQALGQTSQVLSQVNRQKRAIAEEEQKKADRAEFMEADRQVDTLSNDLISRSQTVRLKDAIGMTPKALEEFDKNAREIEGTLKGANAKVAYREAINQRRAQLERSFNAHENGERERYYEKGREDYKSQAHVNAVTNYRDPAAIEAEIDKIRATVDQTPGMDIDQRRAETATRVSAVYAGVVERYLSNDQVKQADAYYKAVKDRVNGPVAADIERALTSAKQRKEAEGKAKLTELKQSLGDELRDIQAAAYAGIPVTNLPSKTVLQAAFGEREGAQRYESAQKLADLSVEIGGLHTLSASDLAKTAQSYRPTQVEGAAEGVQNAQVVSQRAAGILEQRKADPAAYLVTHNPAVSKAWDAFMQAGDDDSRETYLKAVRAERERLQIPGTDVLPDAYVRQVADAISTTDAQKLATTLEQEALKWGADWPEVQGQLAGKLSDTAAVISSGIERSAAVHLAATSKLKETELKALLPPGHKWPDVEAAVDDTFEQFSASLPSEAVGTWNAFRDSATRLTAAYMHQGMSQSNAVQKAYSDLVRDQVVEFRSATFRVPHELNAEEVETGALTLLQSFSTPSGTVIPNGAMSEEEYQSQFADHVRKNGYYMTRPDAKGLRLYVDGGPVLGVGGPVQYTWQELLAQSVALEQQQIEATRKAIDRRKEMR